MMKRDIEKGGSLFGRIGEAATSRFYRQSGVSLLHSISENLHNILNTRSGSCAGSPELGIADLNDDALASGNFREEIAWGIHDCIRRYEPRITGVTVTAASPDNYAPLELRFHIVAQVSFHDARDVLEFDILLDNRQRYRVEYL
ncbi:type VI secretion system baseplate subunit TssE [Citrobacter freundii]|uniref:Type VI secretion system baseplate subunit TssE n=1 Tax=Citrobacter freundii TaxID=546 RepID=A0AAN4EU58_CITFR|nr:type VI secretion system baseplate subunit TssE [Citrobacter freundii]EKW2107766.1 type VI secretion system baseplate subunit TssE [Citrobacter freundii]MBM7189371.1 type VI secretion system baseplate subunit TssE [Citrobacter freundii]MBM7250400.1 type VI secretion system baseplate subunit TssE [Citrobacter freundii]MBM7291748.1 type VI secretion system baseplate subunit TssE [Citrobacter freundii]